MDLTSATLQTMLATIFGVDPMYVVPRQGTWWSPAMLSTSEKPKTWVAYAIESDKPLDIAHFQGDISTTNDSVQHRIASLALQFVGDVAHELALSVGHWIHNPVVAAQFDLVEGRVMGDVGDLTITDFYQEGANTVKAYNVRLRIAWTSRITTGQGVMPGIKITGGLILGV